MTIWKTPQQEHPIQAVPLLVIRKYADLVIADGGCDIAYVDDFGFQCSGSCETTPDDEIAHWCYIGDLLKRLPLPPLKPQTGECFASDEALTVFLKQCRRPK